MKTTTYEPTGGTHIEHAIADALAIAIKGKQRVRMMFNDVVLIATPAKSRVALLREWNTKIRKSAERYRRSRAGRAEAKRAAEELQRHQIGAKIALHTLPALLVHNNLDALIGWLSVFTKHADHVGVDLNQAAGRKSDAHKWIADLFEAKGYKSGMHVGRTPDWFCNRQRMGEYIIGQAIACLRQGMPPHPILNSFVYKYAKLMN